MEDVRLEVCGPARAGVVPAFNPSGEILDVRRLRHGNEPPTGCQQPRRTRDYTLQDLLAGTATVAEEAACAGGDAVRVGHEGRVGEDRSEVAQAPQGPIHAPVDQAVSLVLEIIELEVEADVAQGARVQVHERRPLGVVPQGHQALDAAAAADVKDPAHRGTGRGGGERQGVLGEVHHRFTSFISEECCLEVRGDEEVLLHRPDGSRG
mmetsp:Transcript_79890/g.252545  ORF Transcript_79890/g.252545 Transcript_79890/m.252545 type:complete len:208 (-) Transcript_79890:864-1487(-)